jgi:hypothetical protein
MIELSRKLSSMFLASLFLGNAAGLALDFPGPAGGPVQQKTEGGKFTLANNLVSFSWEVQAGEFHPLAFSDKLDPPTDFTAGPHPFQLAVDNGTPEFVLEGAPTFFALDPMPESRRAARRFAGWGLKANFRDPVAGTTVEWRAELRDGSNYLRQIIRISGTTGTLQRVTLNDFQAAGARVEGTAPGSPIVAGGAFFGFEMPLAQAKADPGGFHFDLDCQLPLQKGAQYEFSSVCGVYPQGQLRRSFLYYLERERARPYAPFLNYNCWFDLVHNVDEKSMAASITAYHGELTEKRGVPIDSYVIDDGWDNYHEGFWTVDKTKFPDGFAPLSRLLRQDGSHLGLWISPLGGYSEREQRTDQARKLGLVSGKSLDLSYPPYYAWFRDRCAAFFREDQVNYFKWDKAGDGVTPHFMALLKCGEELRQINPDLFLNVTVGTWPSPFWLNYIDCTWRGADDMGWEGKGNDREQWLTYRDAQAHRWTVAAGPLYPMNSLMTHGVVRAMGLPFSIRATKAGGNLQNDVRIYFGMGSDLQELYIQPDLMKASDWDDVAEAAAWARRNADVLVDTHWIGGRPEALEPYGFASWSPRKATLAIRNPDDQPRDLVVDAQQIWELPSGAAQQWNLKSPYPNQRTQKFLLKAGTPETIHLQPFEVLVFDGTPDR